MAVDGTGIIHYADGSGNLFRTHSQGIGCGLDLGNTLLDQALAISRLYVMPFDIAYASFKYLLLGLDRTGADGFVEMFKHAITLAAFQIVYALTVYLDARLQRTDLDDARKKRACDTEEQCDRRPAYDGVAVLTDHRLCYFGGSTM